MSCISDIIRCLSFWFTLFSMIIFRCTHVAASGIIVFGFMAELYSMVRMYHIFFIHSSVVFFFGFFFLVNRVVTVQALFIVLVGVT